MGLVQRGVQSVAVCRNILTCWMVEPWNFFRDGVPTKYEAQKKSKLYPRWWSQQVSVGKLMHAFWCCQEGDRLASWLKETLGLFSGGLEFQEIPWSCPFIPFQNTCIYPSKMERKTGWKLESTAKYLQNPRKFWELEPWHHEGFVVIRDNFPVLHVTMANLLVNYRDA